MDYWRGKTSAFCRRPILPAGLLVTVESNVQMRPQLSMGRAHVAAAAVAADKMRSQRVIKLHVWSAMVTWKRMSHRECRPVSQQMIGQSNGQWQQQRSGSTMMMQPPLSNHIRSLVRRTHGLFFWPTACAQGADLEFSLKSLPRCWSFGACQGKLCLEDEAFLDLRRCELPFASAGRATNPATGLSDVQELYVWVTPW
jgi:hypothetical protein